MISLRIKQKPFLDMVMIKVRYPLNLIRKMMVKIPFAKKKYILHIYKKNVKKIIIALVTLMIALSMQMGRIIRLNMVL